MYSYFDSNWVKSSTDPWNITTSYDYNDLGQHTTRTITSADGLEAVKLTLHSTNSYCPKL